MNRKNTDSNKVNKKKQQAELDTAKAQPRGRGPGHGVKVGKPRDFKKSLKKLINYIRPYLVYIMIAVVLSIAATVLTIIGPGKIRELTDIISEGIRSEIDIDAVEKIGIFLSIVYGLSAIFRYIQGFIITTISQRVSRSLRTRISKKINRMKLKYFDSHTLGDTLSRITNDVDLIGQTLNQSVGTIVTSLVLLFGSLLLMFITNWTLAIAAVLSTLIGFRLMIFIIKRSQKYFVAQQKEIGSINGHIEEVYTGHLIVKAYNGENQALEKFKTINERLYESAWKSQFVSGLMRPIMAFTGNFGYVVVSVLGSALAINGTITFGVVVAFMLYVRLFTRPLSQLAQAATSIQSALAASERVAEFLEEDELLDESDKDKYINPKTTKGNIEFKNIKFSYDEGHEIIKDFSFMAKAGQKIAIVGPTGAGKTTMVNLLMRFYEIDQGDILIDDISLQDLKRENIHDLFSMVLQDTWIFEGSIRDNIAYSGENISLEQVIEVSKAVGLHHFVMTLADGYDTVLDDKTTLSSGQKQLITIARAMTENAPLLILDEATSSVDTRTELIIQEAMDKLMHNKTSFIIAHRLSTIKNADSIIVMDGGEIVEIGTHKELMEKQGFYADLYTSQFEQA